MIRRPKAATWSRKSGKDWRGFVDPDGEGSLRLLVPGVVPGEKSKKGGPSAETITDAVLPDTSPAPAWAPLREKPICFPPDPVASSVAVRSTVTSVLFQPLELAAGELVAVVVGGVVSEGGVALAVLE